MTEYPSPPTSVPAPSATPPPAQAASPPAQRKDRFVAFAWIFIVFAVLASVTSVGLLIFEGYLMATADPGVDLGSDQVVFAYDLFYLANAVFGAVVGYFLVKGRRGVATLRYVRLNLWCSLILAFISIRLSQAMHLAPIPAIV